MGIDNLDDIVEPRLREIFDRYPMASLHFEDGVFLIKEVYDAPPSSKEIARGSSLYALVHNVSPKGEV